MMIMIMIMIIMNLRQNNVVVSMMNKLEDWGNMFRFPSRVKYIFFPKSCSSATKPSYLTWYA